MLKASVLMCYLGNLHSSDVCVCVEGDVCVGVEVGQAEVCWRELHCCHLLAVMRTHHML